MHDDAIWDALDALLAGRSPDEQQMREPWLSFQHRSGASDRFPPRQRRRLLTGQGGLTLCQSSGSASRSLAEGGANQRAWSPLQQRERSSKMRAGKSAPSGGPSLQATAHLACGLAVPRVAFATYTSASACFCRFRRLTPAHLCARRPGRMQGPG